MITVAIVSTFNVGSSRSYAADAVNADYETARHDPIHFPPAINSATNEQCLACHQEILDNKPLSNSPAGVAADTVLAWYQTLDTYDGPQMSFHQRHLNSPFAKQVMDLKCNFCHQGSDPREESPDMMPGHPKVSETSPPFTLRKMVNPSQTCLRCHGAMPEPTKIMGLPSAWPEARKLFEPEGVANGCLSCHVAIRTVRHQVNYLKPEGIEEAGAKGSDSCFGCHGGRAWYRNGFPYARTPWPGMDTSSTPDWAVGRPSKSDPHHLLPAGK